MATLNDFYDTLTGWIDLPQRFGVGAEFEDGFLAGIALALVAAALLWLAARPLRRRRACREVTVKGDKGDLIITATAIREFITRIILEFENAALRSVRLRQSRGGIVMWVEIAAVPDADLVPLRDMLQERIIQDAAAKLGLGMPLRVNVQVKSMEADQQKISKRTRKAGIKRNDQGEPQDMFEDYDAVGN